MRNREQIYNDDIDEHMAKIIAVCKKNDIAMITEFFIPTDENPGLCCSSAVMIDDKKLPQHMACMAFIQQKIKRV
jgi:hypothetical protein